MSQTLGRIGKSLLKFIKPVRVTLPHHQPKDPGQFEQPKQEFKLLRFKKPDPSKAGVQEKEKQPLEQTEKSATSVEVSGTSSHVHEKAPAHWLELVVGLLASCRRASVKMRQRIGIETYRRALQARGQTKIQTVGSIIDATSVGMGTPDEKKKSA
jgi:hypothetical protein